MLIAGSSLLFGVCSLSLRAPVCLSSRAKREQAHGETEARAGEESSHLQQQQQRTGTSR